MPQPLHEFWLFRDEVNAVPFCQRWTNCLPSSLGCLQTMCVGIFQGVHWYFFSDLAFKKKTEQSSTINNGFSSRAVDENYSIYFNQKSCTHTKRERNPWWRVDLGREYIVTGAWQRCDRDSMRFSCSNSWITLTTWYKVQDNSNKNDKTKEKQQKKKIWKN